MKLSKPVRIAAIVIGVLFTLGALTAAAVVTVASTQSGRNWVANRFVGVLNGHIRGQVTVGRLESLTLHGIKASHFKIRDPKGETLVEVRYATVEPDWFALLDRRFVLKRGVATDVRLYAALKDGKLDIDETFKSPKWKRSAGDDGGTLRPIVDLKSIYTEHATASVEVDGHFVALNDATLFARIQLLDDGRVRLRFDRASAKVNPSTDFIPAVEIRNMSGGVVTQSAEAATFSGDIILGDISYASRIRLRPEETPPVSIDLQSGHADAKGTFLVHLSKLIPDVGVRFKSLERTGL